MAALANQQHEVFAQNIAKGMNGREAYRAAGYNPNSDASADAAASRLLGNVKVASRVEELQDRAATSTVTTVETLLEAAWGIIKEARDNKDYGAASQTVERAAKIAGLWVDRSKSDNTLTLGQVLDDIPDA